MTINSIEDVSGLHCVDVMHHPDGTFSFKVFRKDPEDEGRWTMVGDYSGLRFQDENAAVREAAAQVPWLAEVISQGKTH
ncbi:hypothetical protein ACVBEF_07385 [Glaciimonas sp. GG7]